MNIFDIIGIFFLCLFALFCFVASCVFSPWWHIEAGIASAMLAWVIYIEKEEKQ